MSFTESTEFKKYKEDINKELTASGYRGNITEGEFKYSFLEKCSVKNFVWLKINERYL